MFVWLDLKTIKFYLIKLATHFSDNQAILADERASLVIYTFIDIIYFKPNAMNINSWP